MDLSLWDEIGVKNGLKAGITVRGMTARDTDKKRSFMDSCRRKKSITYTEHDLRGMHRSICITYIGKCHPRGYNEDVHKARPFVITST